MVEESLDVGRCSRICATLLISSCPGLSRWLRDDKAGSESPDGCGAGIGMGAADMSEIIREKTSTTRPARERLFEYMTDQPNYRKKEKAE